MNYLNIARNLGVEYNVTFRVLDEETKEVVSEHVGHNQATNTMMTGIAHYLKGDGILNQGEAMLGTFIPRYISLGTMGLLNQDQTENGLPAGIGVTPQRDGESDADFEVRRYKEYMEQLPGYGADGYSSAQNNGREYFGLGPMFSVSSVKCELITPAYPRAPITYRAVLPEAESELPETMDIIFSAYISTGSLAKFRGNNDYLFITEVGMWGSRTYKNTSENGLLAAYRIVPPNSENYDMENPANRSILQQNILRVGRNQIVQVIWKIQLGSVEQFGGYVEAYRQLIDWINTHTESSATNVMIRSDVVAISEVHNIDLYYPHFSCDSEYYFDSMVTCTVGVRQYQKANVYPAIGMIIHTIGYSTPFFISTEESGVAYKVSGYPDAQAVNSVVYDGLTWYYSKVPYSMYGDFNDSEGHLLTYAGTVNYDTVHDWVEPDSVLEILQAVHAHREV